MNTFDLAHVNRILGSFGHFSQNYDVARKWLTVERKGWRFGSSVHVVCVWVLLTSNMSRSFWGHLVHLCENWVIAQSGRIIERTR